jgi:XRE family aerobic/anaerobic benzoate catabolism transcriptional regulator
MTDAPGSDEDADDAYLRVVGHRVRDLRAQRGITRRTLAHDSGVSERYLAQLESGQGNPSISVVRALAHAFGVAPDSLVAESEVSPLASGIIATIRHLDDDQLVAVHRLLRTTLSKGEPTARNSRIALIGLRGAGKSTIGALVAQRLQCPFIELDREVERDAGASLSEIFEFYGQAGFRRQERASLERILENEGAFVLATGGSIVSEPVTFERVLGSCFTVWLTASPKEHMERVVAQGDMRPMAGNREAMADLKRILAGREALYRRGDAELSTSGRTIEQTVEALLEKIPTPAARIRNRPAGL